MLISLSLRLRTFLLFFGSAVACMGLVGLSHYFALSRLDSGGEMSAFLTSATLSAFAIVAVTTTNWLLFDENVAKPMRWSICTSRASSVILDPQCRR